jgi:hypothetical protein
VRTAIPALETPSIGAQTIQFGDAVVTGNRFAVRAFVPTGSVSQHCVATISESNFAVPGITVLCAPRDLAGQHGVLFSAFFPQPVPTGLILSATLYQEYRTAMVLQYFSAHRTQIVRVVP